MADTRRDMQGQVPTTITAALDLVPFAMLVTDSSGSALSVNQRWCELSGISYEASLGSGWLDALSAETRPRLLASLREVAAHSANLSEDHQIGRPQNRRWVRWWISRHAVAGVSMLAVAAADVDDDYARQADLYHLATHDPLTGLFNRRHFMEAIDQALLRNQRSAHRVGVVYVDLDGFKGVNDRAGHAMGDRVLSAVGARLRHAVRSADLVARIGGDEFAVLCEGLGEEEQAEVVASRIASALADSVELEGERWAVTASVGAAVDLEGHLSASELIDRADRAMYSVKHSRRGPQRVPSAGLSTASGAAEVRIAPVAGPATPSPPVSPFSPPAVSPFSPPASPPERRVADRRAGGYRPEGGSALTDASASSRLGPAAGSGERLSLLDGIAALKESIESLRVALEKLLASGRRSSDWVPAEGVQS